MRPADLADIGNATLTFLLALTIGAGFGWLLLECVMEAPDTYYMEPLK